MTLTALDGYQMQLTEKELNSTEHAPPEIIRYAYNAADVKGIKYAEGPGISISGGLRYIREDLIKELYSK